jgi:histidine triad (HIT) family protein
MLTVGLEVPHAHLHLIPIQHAGDINFENEKLKLSKDELKAIQEAIVHQLEK